MAIDSDALQAALLGYQSEQERKSREPLRTFRYGSTCAAADTDFERHGDSLAPATATGSARVRAMPSVEAAAITRSLPIESGAPDGHFFIEGRRAETGNADADYTRRHPRLPEGLSHPAAARARFR